MFRDLPFTTVQPDHHRVPFALVSNLDILRTNYNWFRLYCMWIVSVDRTWRSHRLNMSLGEVTLLQISLSFEIKVDSRKLFLAMNFDGILNVYFIHSLIFFIYLIIYKRFPNCDHFTLDTQHQWRQGKNSGRNQLWSYSKYHPWICLVLARESLLRMTGNRTWVLAITRSAHYTLFYLVGR